MSPISLLVRLLFLLPDGLGLAYDLGNQSLDISAVILPYFHISECNILKKSTFDYCLIFW